MSLAGMVFCASPKAMIDQKRPMNFDTQLKPTQSFCRGCFRWWNHTPLTALLVFVLLSVVLKENYPFSHFPMYASPSPERHYIRVTDAKGDLLPIATLTGITSPKIGKIYRKKTEDEARRKGIRVFDLPLEDRQAVGLEIFAYLRAQAARLRQTLPEKMQLAMVMLSFENGEVCDRPEIIVTE